VTWYQETKKGRNVEGRTFVEYSRTPYRDEARARAKKLRDEGWDVRITKPRKLGDYVVLKSTNKKAVQPPRIKPLNKVKTSQGDMFG
jgi:hypothetical protein